MAVRSSTTQASILTTETDPATILLGSVHSQLVTITGKCHLIQTPSKPLNPLQTTTKNRLLKAVTAHQPV